MGKQTISRNTLVKIVVACVIAAISLAIVGIGDYSISSRESEQALSGELEGLTITPGTYTATAYGMESDVTATCTFDESGITSIDVDVSGETAGVGAEIGDEMESQFLAAQGSQVDGVSGASITSGALMEAVSDCIDQATGRASAESAGDASDDEEAVTEEETEAVVAEEAETEAAAAASAAPASYVPGTYTASAQGMESDVTVTIEVDDSSILSCDVDVSGETDGIGAAIGDEITDQIMDAQSADIEGVSGASVSSGAIREALGECLAEAQSGDTEEAVAAAEPETEEITEAVVEEETEAAVEEETEEATEAVVEEETEEVSEAAEPAAAAEAAPASFVPGTYSASASGMESDVTVTIEVDDSSILSCDVDVSGETDGIGAAIGDEITDQIMDAQSADIEGVSGASVSSGAVREALGECLAEAQSGDTEEAVAAAEPETEEITEAVVEEETEAAVEEETEEATEAVVEEETEEATESAAEPETEEATEAVVEEETEEATEAVVEEETEEAAEAAVEEESEEAAAAAVEGSYVPGTYSASASGIESDVTVTIVTDESSILSVGVDVSGETDGIGAAIGDEVTEQILNAQSADIEGVSGASITSGAVKEALNTCIEEAQSGELNESEAASDGAYVPGSYTAEAKGMESDVTVTVTFSEDAILSVGVDVSGETEGVGAAIGDEITEQILQAQSADIEGVSGATVSSTAVKEALEDCIAQAGGSIE